MGQIEERIENSPNAIAFGSGGHDYSVDMLRAFSCFMVVCVHTAGFFLNSNWYSPLVGGSSSWYAISFFRAMFASPTVMFVMVSAIFLLTPSRNVTIKKVWMKNVLKMAAVYVLWCYIYSVADSLIFDPGRGFDLMTLTRGALKEPMILWYIPMIIVLYVLAPVLRLLTANYEEKIAKYAVTLFVVSICLNTLLMLPSLPFDTILRHLVATTPAQEICQYTSWFLFGWYLYSHRPSDKMRHILYALGLASVIVAFVVNVVVYYDPVNFAETNIIKKFTITTFCKNTAIFLFFVTAFRNVKPKGVWKFLLKKASGSTLIVYLLHWLLIMIFMEYQWLWDSGIPPAVLVFVYVFTAYISSVVVASLFHAVPWGKMRDGIWSAVRRGGSASGA
jgi:surface polysaccharide O-acyltransferase-like enzyme